ncbi:MAG: hypothetical protein HXS41_14035 [Theionarchaea archaeon]|nr:hypothetical protein [Theionarchaea archaeon]
MNNRMVGLGPGLMILMLFFSTWTPVVKISTHEANAKFYSNNPDMGIDAEGNTYVVWEGYDGSDRDIFWTRIDAEGNPGTVMKLTDGEQSAGYDDHFAHIAVDSEGNSYVTWTGSFNDDSDVYWARIDESGALGNVLNVSCRADYVTNNNWNSQIAVDSEGNSYVVWQGFDGERDSSSNADIYWVRIESSGTMDDMVKVSTHEDNKMFGDVIPQIAIDNEANSYVVWQGCDKDDCWKDQGDFEIYWTKVGNAGSPGKVLKVSAFVDSTSILGMIPQLAVDGSGTSYVVWSGLNGENYDIYWVRIDTNGVLKDAQRILSYSASMYDDYNPRTAIDDSKALYIVWENFNGNDYEVYFVKIESDELLGKVQKVSNYPKTDLYDDYYPDIAVNAGRESYIVWSRFNQKSGRQSEMTVFWTKIDSSGNQEGFEKISSSQLSRYTNRQPQIAVDKSGKSFVIWVGKDESSIEQIFFTASTGDSISLIVALIVIVLCASTIMVLKVFFAEKRRKNE